MVTEDVSQFQRPSKSMLTPCSFNSSRWVGRGQLGFSMGAGLVRAPRAGRKTKNMASQVTMNKMAWWLANKKLRKVPKKSNDISPKVPQRPNVQGQPGAAAPRWKVDCPALATWPQAPHRCGQRIQGCVQWTVGTGDWWLVTSAHSLHSGHSQHFMIFISNKISLRRFMRWNHVVNTCHDTSSIHKP